MPRSIGHRGPLTIIDTFTEYWAPSPLSHSDLLISRYARQAYSPVTRICLARGWRPRNSGKWVCEIDIEAKGSLKLYTGLTKASHPTADVVIGGPGVAVGDGYGFNTDGDGWANGFQAFGGPFWAGGAIQLCADLDAGRLWFGYYNTPGLTFGYANGSGNPALGTSPSFGIPTGVDYYPSCAMRSVGDQMAVRFRAQDLTWPIPSGFAPWDASTPPVFAARPGAMSRHFFGAGRAGSGWDIASAQGSGGGAHFTLSASNRIATRIAESSAYGSIRGAIGHASGKYHLEFRGGTVFKESRVVGLANTSVGTNVGATTNSIGLVAATGAVLFNNGSLGTVAPNRMGGDDVLALEVDLDNKLTWWKVHGVTDWNNNPSADPATGVGGLSYSSAGTMYPAWSTNSNQTLGTGLNDSLKLITGGHFIIPPSTGFSAWA